LKFFVPEIFEVFFCVLESFCVVVDSFCCIV